MNERNRYLTDEELDSLFPRRATDTGATCWLCAHCPAVSQTHLPPTPLGQSALGVGGRSGNALSRPVRHTWSERVRCRQWQVTRHQARGLPVLAKLMEDVDEDGLTRDEAVDLKI